MKNDRMSLQMICASLVVVALITGLLFHQQGKSRSTQARIQGISVVHTLSSMPFSQLTREAGRSGLLHALINNHENPDFGYAVIVDPQGAKLAGITSPGIDVPVASFSTEPSAWFGDHVLVSPQDGRKVREFYGPILNQGDLAGYVRVGYFAPGGPLATDQLSFFASLALPVFLLVPLFCFMLKREMKPLSEINHRIEQLVAVGNSKPIEISPSGDLHDFMRRFSRFVQLADARVRELESERASALTSNHLLGYKKEKLETVLQALPEAIMVIDEVGSVTFASAKVEPVLGVHPDSVLGRLPQEWCNDPDLVALLTRYRNQSANAYRSESMDYASNRVPDKKLNVTAYPLFSPLEPNRVFSTLLVFRDNTQELLAKRAGIEFVANVSHELKTPLNVLAMYSEMLLDSAENKTLNIEAVNVIHDEVERMSGLIANLLNIAKIEMGSVSLDRERVKLSELLLDVFDNVSKVGAGRDLKFDLQLPSRISPVAIDKDLLRIALNNLLTNAIKYNKPGGLVILSAEEDDDQITISVRDSGIGISLEDQQHVFDKFYRSADREASGRGGHGLGLFLCKEIVELHQGKLTVTSEPGLGTKFTIALAKSPLLLREEI